MRGARPKCFRWMYRMILSWLNVPPGLISHFVDGNYCTGTPYGSLGHFVRLVWIAPLARRLQRNHAVTGHWWHDWRHGFYLAVWCDWADHDREFRRRALWYIRQHSHANYCACGKRKVPRLPTVRQCSCVKEKDRG